MADIDPTSDLTVLRRVDGVRPPTGVPDRDLHGGDISRVAYLWLLGRSQEAEAEAPARPAVGQTDLVEAAAWLVASGGFTRAEPDAPTRAPRREAVVTASGGSGDV